MMLFLILAINSVLMRQRECRRKCKYGLAVGITLIRGSLAKFPKYYDKTSSRAVKRWQESIR